MRRFGCRRAISFALAVTALPLGCGESKPSTAPSTALQPGPAPLPTATPTPAPATLADLAAAVTSPQADRLLNCREEVVARVTLTNNALSPVLVNGVRRRSRLLSGNCGTPSEFVHRYGNFVPARQTAVVLNAPLYSGGSGCCPGGCGGRTTCSIEESLFVQTAVGELFAGNILYRVNFLDCGACDLAASSAGRPCASSPR